MVMASVSETKLIMGVSKNLFTENHMLRDVIMDKDIEIEKLKKVNITIFSKIEDEKNFWEDFLNKQKKNIDSKQEVEDLKQNIDETHEKFMRKEKEFREV